MQRTNWIKNFVLVILYSVIAYLSLNQDKLVFEILESHPSLKVIYVIGLYTTVRFLDTITTYLEKNH